VAGLRTKSGDANFPNAEVIVPSGEWKHWNDEGELGKAADARQMQVGLKFYW
jgi:hypothetical protein